MGNLARWACVWVWVLVLGGGGGVGCAQTQELRWRVLSSDVGEAPQLVEAVITEGTCAAPGREVARGTVGPAARAQGASMAVPVTLAAGSFAFRVRARDAQCRWYAEACEPVTLPRSGLFELRLVATAREDACGASVCVDGVCVAGGEGGARDAGPDAAAVRMDSGSDSGPDSGYDSGPDSGSDSGPDSGSDSGPDSGADSGPDSGPDSGAPDSGPPQIVRQIAVGRFHTCVLLVSGAVKCWGYDGFGQLGDGTVGSPDKNPVPVPVVGLGSGVVAISASAFHTCAVMATGAVRCWGENATGQLGRGAVGLPSGTPVAVSNLAGPATGVASGFNHSCALLQSGRVQCWGFDDNGQLGDGVPMPTRPTPGDVVGLTGVTAITAGDGHSCALSTGGALHCWGQDDRGQLGDGLPLQPRATPVRIFASGVTRVAAGELQTCALAGGNASCWGNDLDGQLGGGTASSLRSTPGMVTGLSAGVSALASGAETTCFVVAGRVWCTGSNVEGQLGDPAFGGVARATPNLVEGLPPGMVSVGVGADHACATDGASVYCWGGDPNGQCGDGALGPDYGSIPSPVVGL